MTIQVFIEGEDHGDIVRQLKGLAEALGGTRSTTIADKAKETSDAIAATGKMAPAGDGIETPPQKEPPASTTTTNVPNPTKKTIALAEKFDVDLDQVQGSGKDGRVTQVDVKKYVEQRQSEGESAEPETPDEEPATVPATSPFSDGETIEPTKDNATAALRVVHGEKGMDACMKVLSALGANRVSEVPEEHYPAFLVACAETLGVDTASLKQQIDGLAA